jgi:hypothetical protein
MMETFHLKHSDAPKARKTKTLRQDVADWEPRIQWLEPKQRMVGAVADGRPFSILEHNAQPDEQLYSMLILNLTMWRNIKPSLPLIAHSQPALILSL